MALTPDKNTILHYLRTLELPADKSITQEELRSKFRKLAKKYHPDVASEKDKDGSRFVEIKKAYDWLTENIEYTNRQIASGFALKAPAPRRQERKPAPPAKNKSSQNVKKTPPPDPKTIAKNFAEGIKRVEFNSVKYHSYIFTYGLQSSWGKDGYEVYKGRRSKKYGTLEELKENILTAINSEPGIKSAIEFGLDSEQKAVYTATVNHMLSVASKEYDEDRQLREHILNHPHTLLKYYNGGHSIFEYKGQMYVAFIPKSSAGSEEKTSSIYKLSVEKPNEIRLSFDRYIKKGFAPYVDAEEIWKIKLITSRMIELEGINKRVDCVLAGYGSANERGKEYMKEIPRGICRKCGKNRAILGACTECRKYIIHGFKDWRVLKDGSIIYK